MLNKYIYDSVVCFMFIVKCSTINMNINMKL